MTAKNKGTIIPCGPDMMKGHYKAIKFILEKGAGNTVQFTHQYIETLSLKKTFIRQYYSYCLIKKIDK